MAHNQIGISSYSYVHACGAGMTPIELVQKAIDLQVSVIQMADNIHLEKFTDVELLAAKELADMHNITLETGFRGLLPEFLDQYFHITKLLGAHLMRVVIDANGYQPPIDAICELVESIVPILEKEKIVLGIETHDRFTSQQFVEIIKKIHSKYVGIILDTANSLSTEELQIQVTETVGPYVVCFHVKDYTIRRRTINLGLEIVGTIAGTGHLNIPDIIKRLDRLTPYAYNLILEFWMDKRDTIEATLTQEQDWVEKSIMYLKSVV